MKLKSLIERIIAEVGPRPAGSEAEFRAGEIIAAEFKKRGASLSLHDTNVCPGIIPGLINTMALFYAAGLVAYLFLPALAGAIVAVMLAALLLTRVLGNGVIDWLFKRARTRNVIGAFSPKKGAPRTLIFSGHHDSPDHMPLFYLPFKPYIHLVESGAVAGAALLLIAAVLRHALGDGSLSAGSPPAWHDALYALSLAGFGLMLFYRFKMISGQRNLGANDNLSAVAVLVGIADYLKRRPPKKTEVLLVSFGAEEPLIYGSAGFARDNAELVRRAVNVNMETVGAGRLAVISKEKMTFTRYTPEVVSLIRTAGKRAGVDLPAVEINYGGTDSYPLVKKGGRSACLFGMDETGLFSLWHSPMDNPANIREENLRKALDICIEIIKEFETR